MKRFWLTFVMIALFAGLGAYVYLNPPKGESLQTSGKAETESQVTDENFPLFQMEPDDIKEIRLISRETIRLLQDDGQWWISGKPRLRADLETMNQLVETVANLKAKRQLTNGEEDETIKLLATYGLEHPLVRVEINTNDDSRSLLVGSETPIGGAYYAKLEGSSPIYTIDATAVELFRKDVPDLRDRTVVSFDRSKVTRIAIDRPKGPLILNQGPDEKWYLEKPFRDLADHHEVFALMWDFIQMRAEEFVTDLPADPAPYGLDKPTLTARFHITEGSKQGMVTLFIGVRKGEDTYYVKRASSDSVYLVSLASFPPLTLEASDLVERELVNLQDKKILSFEYRDPKRALYLRQTGEGWKLEKGNSEAISLTQEEASSLWDQLDDIRITEIIVDPQRGEFGFGNPAATLEWKFEESKELNLTIGHIKNGKTESYYIRSNLRPLVYQADPEVVSRALRRIEALAEMKETTDTSTSSRTESTE